MPSWPPPPSWEDVADYEDPVMTPQESTESSAADKPIQHEFKPSMDPHSSLSDDQASTITIGSTYEDESVNTISNSNTVSQGQGRPRDAGKKRVQFQPNIQLDSDPQKRRLEPIYPAYPRRPDVLSFLDKDSPDVTEERIRQTLAEASEDWSPRSYSSMSSSVESQSRRSTADTDATSPDQSISGDMYCSSPDHRSMCVEHDTYRPTAHPHQQRIYAPRNPDVPVYRSYGTPEMARGPTVHPHMPPKEPHPRMFNPSKGHPKYLPRGEKLPLTGYELLAAKLSAPQGQTATSGAKARETAAPGAESDIHIKPIYRRFEALNHRLLLHLQDEISELEEQLHRLDTADTRTRRLQNCILPASRRAESMAGGELQWHKTDVLGKIGFKLGQYNNVLTSFAKTQKLQRARFSDVEDYRTYLATRNPIAESETRFLDPIEDLICLVPDTDRSMGDETDLYSSYTTSDEAQTPMPRQTTFGMNQKRVPARVPASSSSSSPSSVSSNSTNATICGRSLRTRPTPFNKYKRGASIQEDWIGWKPNTRNTDIRLEAQGHDCGSGADIIRPLSFMRFLSNWADELCGALKLKPSLLSVVILLTLAIMIFRFILGEFVGRMAVVLVVGFVASTGFGTVRGGGGGIWISPAATAAAASGEDGNIGKDGI